MDYQISRQAAIDLFPNDDLEWDTNYGYIAPHFARRMIEELLPTQPEIIHCKDCRNADDYNHCQLVNWWTGPEDYCSRAEVRKEGE